MALVTTDAIALRSNEFGDKERIVVFLTEKQGKVPVVVKRTRSKKFNFAAIEPMTLCRLTYFGKENAHLYRFSNAEIINYFGPVREDLMLLNYSACFSEILLFLLKDFDQNKHVFEVYKNFLEQLSQFKNEHNHLSIVLFLSLIQVFRSVGIYHAPSDSCCSCKKKLLVGSETKIRIIDRGGICPDCYRKMGHSYHGGRTDFFTMEISSLKLLEALSSSKFAVAVKLKLPTPARKEIFQFLLWVYQNFTHRDLKSVNVFKEINAAIV